MKQELILHSGEENKLSQHYRKAFKEAVELLVVSAYLTEWDSTLQLNDQCKYFRIIVGQDFGITKKDACQKVKDWLPKKQKGNFKVANVNGFHPKAIFWKNQKKEYFAIIGSSNLTEAAFNTNYEANVYMSISSDEFMNAKNWFQKIEEQSVPVDEKWLSEYSEAQRISNSGTNKSKAFESNLDEFSNLPVIKKIKEEIDETTKIFVDHLKGRREQLQNHQKYRDGLKKLFYQCAEGKITNQEFYNQLPKYWSYACGNRLQGRGWEISGKHSDFQELSKSFVKILEAKKSLDEVVANEIDYLCEKNIPTRGSFLSEMLCLEYPDKFPLKNDPVMNYFKGKNMGLPSGISEGKKYIEMAKKLREDLPTNLKNLAEFDAYIYTFSQGFDL